MNQVEVYEAQLKKMRDIIDDKNVQVSQLHTLLERYKVEALDLQHRSRNEVEIVKNRMSSQQIDHLNEIEIVKNKFELHKDAQFRNVQHAHINQAEILQSEIDKMRNLMSIKNVEIETLLT